MNQDELKVHDGDASYSLTCRGCDDAMMSLYYYTSSLVRDQFLWCALPRSSLTWYCFALRPLPSRQSQTAPTRTDSHALSLDFGHVASY